VNITPLLDRVVLRPIEKDSITKSGIILPDGANKERPSIYEVVAI
jgi:co-chaperonin GroES (HSP10)